MTKSIGTEQMDQLTNAVMNAPRIAQAAFILIPYEKLLSDWNIRDSSVALYSNPESYMNALNKNNWRYLLNLSRQERGISEFANFAAFLPKLSRADTMEILSYPGDEPLFTQACKFKSIPYKVLCLNPKLNKTDKSELIHMCDAKGRMVFPELLDAGTIKCVLKEMTHSKKLKLFNEYINDGEKSFFYLHDKGLIQQDELCKMKPDAAYKFLTSPVAINETSDYKEASVLSILEINKDNKFLIQRVLDMPWTPKQLKELVCAPLGCYGHNTQFFFTQDILRRGVILKKLSPKYRHDIVFSDIGLEQMERDFDGSYCTLLMNNRNLFTEKSDRDKIFEYYKDSCDRNATRHAEQQEEEQEKIKAHKQSFAGVFTKAKYNDLIIDLKKTRLKKNVRQK